MISGAALSGCKLHASFVDAASTCVPILCRLYPTYEVPARVRREIAPLRLCHGRSCERVVKVERHYGKTARASLSVRKHRACALDPSSSRLGLFGCVYPTNKVPPRDRRKILPLALCRRRGRQGFEKIGGHFVHSVAVVFQAACDITVCRRMEKAGSYGARSRGSLLRSP